MAAEGRAANLPARLRSGDPATLAELAEAWGPRLYRYLARLTPDPETARDLAQETLVRALKAMLGGARPDDVLAWLYRIATNLARDEHKSAYRRRVELYDALEPPAVAMSDDNPERIVLDAGQAVARQVAVRRAVAELDGQLREVIILRFVEELPVKAIAVIQGIPEGTAKSRLYRAYRALEARLGAWRPDGEEGSDG